MSSTLGEYIQNRRGALGLTQAELGRRAGIPRTTVNRVETGTTKLPDAAVRRALAKALGVSHLELLIAAGEVSGEEASLPADHRSPAVRRLQPLVDSVDWDEGTFKIVESTIAAIRDMKAGTYQVPVATWEEDK